MPRCSSRPTSARGRREGLSLRFFTAVARRFPGGLLLGRGRRSLAFVSSPDTVEEILRNRTAFGKDAPMYAAAAPFLGRSLTVSAGGADWRLRRRVVAPVFARHRLPAAAAATQRSVNDLVSRWTGERGGRLNIAHEMRRLCAEIACRTLFGLEEIDDVDGLAHDFHSVSDYVVGAAVLPFPRFRRRREFEAALRRIHAFVDDACAVSPLLAEAVEKARLGGMSRDETREELTGLLFAGHETLADTLTWSLHLVMANPRVAARLREEARLVLGGRTATFADVPELPVARAVLQEAMRLYPVVWLSMRRVRDAVVVDGRRLAAGSLVVWSPYAVHRDPVSWPEPERFDPGRFTGTTSHRGTPGFRPFGAGERACPGADLGFAEACVVLSSIAQCVELRPHPGNASIRPRPAMTLRPHTDPVATAHPARIGCGAR